MFHKVILIGNLGQDPELRYTDSGKAVTNISVATNQTYHNSSGEKVVETTWFKVAVWGKQAEAVCKYLGKGRQVFIEGRLTADENGNPRIFNKRDGTSGASFDVSASTVQFLGGRDDAQKTQPSEEREEIPF